jgi:O-glycosyl hydrolase
MEDLVPDFLPNKKILITGVMKNILSATGLSILLLVNAVHAQNMIVNGAVKYQTLHGLGVNINPQSWNVNPDSVKKVIDSLITGLGATSFRLMYDDCDWETVNDNDDPNTYNWAYYDSVYSAPRFTCVWNTVEYLNTKGITDITLSPDGATPGWMGATKLKNGFEAEYAETISSMVYYGLRRRRPAIQFIMISPINETTCGGDEGVLTTPEQYGVIYADIAKHLINDKMTELSIIGPDDCGGWAKSYHAMVSSPITMSKILRFGQHDYGDETKKIRDLIDSIKHSPYPDREAIMTEANASCVGCDGGTYNKSYGFNYYAGPAYKYILQHLNAGTNGVQIWEGYDSQYHHPNRSLTWSMWGIFSVDDTLHPDTYRPRAHYYTFKQLFNFVKPGFKRIDISTSLPKMTVSAYYSPADKRLVITGKNDSEKAQEINGILKDLPVSFSLQYYYTDETHNFYRGSDVGVSHQGFSQLLPAFCVFTLVTN